MLSIPLAWLQQFLYTYCDSLYSSLLATSGARSARPTDWGLLLNCCSSLSSWRLPRLWCRSTTWPWPWPWCWLSSPFFWCLKNDQEKQKMSLKISSFIFFFYSLPWKCPQSYKNLLNKNIIAEMYFNIWITSIHNLKFPNCCFFHEARCKS